MLFFFLSYPTLNHCQALPFHLSNICVFLLFLLLLSLLWQYNLTNFSKCSLSTYMLGIVLETEDARRTDMPSRNGQSSGKEEEYIFKIHMVWSLLEQKSGTYSWTLKKKMIQRIRQFWCSPMIRIWHSLSSHQVREDRMTDNPYLR